MNDEHVHTWIIKLEEPTRCVRGDCEATLTPQQLAEKLARFDALRAALELDTPFPITEVLSILASAASHSATAHGCDQHGYEVVMQAHESAHRIGAKLAALEATNA